MLVTGKRDSLCLPWNRVSPVWLATALTTVLVTWSVVNAAEPASPNMSVLSWRNGDELPGQLLALTPQEITWETPLFAEPIQVAVGALTQISFPGQVASADTLPTGQLALETMAGNRLLGRVTSISDAFVTLESPKYGELKLERASIWAISNPARQSSVVAGLSGLEGWTTRTYGRKLSEWEELSGGRLTTRLVAAELYRPLEFVGRIEINIELQWSRNPSFQIRFLTPFAETTRETLKVDTRADRLVVHALGSDGTLQPLGELPKRAKECRFSLRWDHIDQQLAIHLDNEYLGKIQVERRGARGSAGLYIKNTGPSLTIARLEITGGRRLREGLSDPNLDRVITADESFSGAVLQQPGAKRITVKQDNGNVIDLDWDSVSGIRFRGEQGQDTDDDAWISCVFVNGETLRGQVQGADEKTIWLRLPSMQKSIQCDLDDIERINLNEPHDPPGIHAPRILMGNKMLHGRLLSGPDGGPSWQPIGSTRPSRLTNQVSARVTLRPPGASSIMTADSDTVCMLNGDMFPCEIDAFREQRLSLATTFAGSTHVDYAAIRAVQFAAADVQPRVGFDEGWTASGDVELDDSRRKVTFGERGGTWTKRRAFRGNVVEFRLSTAMKFAQLQFTFLGRSGSDSERLQLVMLRDRLFVMTDRSRVTRSFTPVGLPARVRLHTGANLQVEINDKLVFSQASSSEPRSGLSIRVAPLAERGRQEGRPPSEAAVTIDSFRVRGSNHRSLASCLPFLEDALITLPRQQSDPPQQLLLGLNNDMVRGVLTSLDDATVTFRSRSREFRVPRTAVTGLVWYAVPAPPAPSLMRVVLTDHSLVTLGSARIEGEYLQGRHPELGELQLPLETVSELLLGGVARSDPGAEIPRLVAKRAPEPQFQGTALGRKHRVDSPLLGKQLSDLEFPLLNDQVKRLFEYEGSVLILEFWATWCAPCVKNMSPMIELAKDLSESSVALLAVNFREEKHLVEEMRDARNWDVDVALDPTGMLARNFMVESLPYTVIIDQDGKVSAVFVGAGSDVLDEIRGVIEQLVQP